MRDDRRLPTLVMLSAVLLAFPTFAQERSKPLKPVPVTAVRVNDPFWSLKLKVYREGTIPHSWPYVASSIEELKNAAQADQKPVEGHGLWSEANLHKVLETASYALANRERSQQEVWITQTGKRERPDGWEDRLYREYADK